MQYRPIGDTDIKVSLICLGTMTFGEQNSEADGHEQLDAALAAGVNFIDTAEMYSVPPRPETYGATESIIGTWLRKRNNRDQVILATKAAGPSRLLPQAAHIRGGNSRYNRRNLEEALDGSLRRLQTDYVDLYQLHWPDRSTNHFGRLGYEHLDDNEDDAVPIQETLEVLSGFVKSGKVRHIGVSNETPWGTLTFIRHAERQGLARIVSIQNPYNLLNRSFEVGLAEVSHREKVGLLAYSPLGFGVLSGKYLGGAKPAGARLTLWERFGRYNSPEAEAATTAYVELAREYGHDPAQLALAYVNSRPFLTSNIIGATTLEQLQSNLRSVDIQLAPEVVERIEAIHTRYPNPSP
ncbi:MAG: aldo/keto reductase [Proteobacteria bacterium]|nr:aldo/keto reductase [Pseudomonadota bacterium]